MLAALACGFVFPTNADAVNLLPLSDEAPVWVDGDRVAFVRQGQPGACSAKWEMREVRRDGSGERSLGRPPTDMTGCTSLWSPAGRRIAFSGFGGDPMVVSNADGTGAVTLPTGRAAAWSPDATQLAYNTIPPATGAGFGLFSVPAAGGPATKLADDVSEAAWSTLGRIAFVAGGGIYSVAEDGSDKRLIDQASGLRRSDLIWSPDGAKLAYLEYGLTRWGPGPSTLIVVGATGEGRIAVWRDEPLRGDAPAWSPTGGELAVATQEGLVVAKADGSGLKTISRPHFKGFGGPGLQTPAWSPDGSWIAANVRGGDHCGNGIELIRPDGSDWRRITNDCRIFGTPGPDRILGTPGPDLIYAGQGDDVVETGGEEDLIYAGAGDDVINAGNGDDFIYAGAGDDRVYTGRAFTSQAAWGGPGDDRMIGGPGWDVLGGGAGRDIIRGGRGGDEIVGGPGRDRLMGEASVDRFWARDRFRDLVLGGPGRDYVERADARDIIRSACLSASSALCDPQAPP